MVYFSVSEILSVGRRMIPNDAESFVWEAEPRGQNVVSAFGGARPCGLSVRLQGSASVLLCSLSCQVVGRARLHTEKIWGGGWALGSEGNLPGTQQLHFLENLAVCCQWEGGLTARIPDMNVEGSGNDLPLEQKNFPRKIKSYQ